MLDSNCDECVFAMTVISDDGDLVLKCRRYPPQLFLDEDGGVSQAFPDAWQSCGEFKQKNPVE